MPWNYISLQAAVRRRRSQGLVEVEMQLRMAIADLTARANSLAAKVVHEVEKSRSLSKQAEDEKQDLQNARAIAQVETHTFDLLKELNLVSTSSRYR